MKSRKVFTNCGKFIILHINFHFLFSFIFSVNSVYGKFGENVLKQTEQEVVFDEGTFNKNVLSPYYKSHQIINENLVVVEKYKDHISLNKPIQIASAILELAKFTMYNYFYNVLIPAFGKRAELCYTDTDSLVVRLKTKNLDKDLKQVKYKMKSFLK
jgi:hypothetical protein